SSVIKNGGAGYKSCADVNEARYNASPRQDKLNLIPESSVAVRNERYKLVRNVSEDYVDGKFVTLKTEELFEVNQAVPTPLLDKDKTNLDWTTNAQIKAVYDDLSQKLDRILASNPECPGDGNMDGVVDSQDLDHWARIARDWGLSSVYDFVTGTATPRDGKTDAADGAVIQSHQGPCQRTYALY